MPEQANNQFFRSLISCRYNNQLRSIIEFVEFLYFI